VVSVVRSLIDRGLGEVVEADLSEVADHQMEVVEEVGMVSCP